MCVCVCVCVCQMESCAENAYFSLITHRVNSYPCFALVLQHLGLRVLDVVVRKRSEPLTSASDIGLAVLQVIEAGDFSATCRRVYLADNGFARGDGRGELWVRA